MKVASYMGSILIKDLTYSFKRKKDAVLFAKFINSMQDMYYLIVVTDRQYRSLI